MEKERNVLEKSQSTFTKRIGNTTFKVKVHFAENTTDTSYFIPWTATLM